uniref:Uncharacterized protein n=1 Tax=Micrurus lemniscatus lemniscatus TaxID=129467 RepID=A0A2D4I3B4_MICLE
MDSLLYFSLSLANLTKYSREAGGFSTCYYVILILWVKYIKDQGQIIVSLLHPAWPKKEVGICRSGLRKTSGRGFLRPSQKKSPTTCQVLRNMCPQILYNSRISPL